MPASTLWRPSVLGSPETHTFSSVLGDALLDRVAAPSSDQAKRPAPLFHGNVTRDATGAEGSGGTRCRIVTALVARTFRQDLTAMMAPRRGTAQIARARQIAMYLAHVELGLSLTAVGLAFRRDRTTVRHACRLVEEWRDDPQMDTMIACLEHSVRASGVQP